MRQLCALVALATTCWASPALADVYCGASNPNHDAPNGHVIFSRAETGIVPPVMQALGEWRTHSMLSNGPSWLTHAGMRMPGVVNATGTNPLHINDLWQGDPGASQVPTAAAYIYLFHEDNGGLTWIRKQGGGDEGVTVANWFWNSMEYEWKPHTCKNSFAQGYGRYYYQCSSGNLAWAPTNTSYSERIGGGYYRLKQGGRRVPYSLHQYSNISNTHLGDVYGGAPGYNWGVVCSTLLAYGVHHALGRNVEAFLYPHGAVGEVGTSAHALNTMRYSVYYECKESDSPFYIDWFNFIFFGAPKDNACINVANQVANTVSHNIPDAGNQYYWNDAVNNPDVRAYSISPDGIAGWRPDQTDWGDANRWGPWSPQEDEAVTFSGGGTTYTCWTNGGV